MEGKKILLTGATSGLGQALSYWLSDLSTDLYLLSRSEEKLRELQSKLACPSQICAADFSKENELAQALNQVLKINFIPDIVIHCAGGGFKLHDPLLSRFNFSTVLDVNLSAIIQINHALLPRMLERRSGLVIHIGSIASAAAQGSVVYNTVKAGLAAYVRSLGRALAPTGVVVTGISPGSFVADNNNMSRFRDDKPDEFECYVANLPAQRMVDVKELFPVIKTICEQKNSLFCGCMLPVDGGEGMSYT